MSLIERIYFASPVILQQLAVTTYGFWWYRRRFGRGFAAHVEAYRAREHWTRVQFERLQVERLQQVLAAASASPYYGRLFDEFRISLQADPFENLCRLPLLSKEILRTRPEDLLTRPLDKGDVAFKSSGTTGTPTKIYYSPDFHQLELAVPEARNLGWAGVSYRDRRVMFGVRKVCAFDQEGPPFWRFSLAEDMAYASIYHLKPENLPDYIAFLRRFKPKVIMGYPSALQTIASYAIENGDFPAPAAAVFTTSETVTQTARERIETAWQSRIYDRYGAVENCHFASECEYGRYHVSPEVGIIEILDHEGKPAPPGEIGEVVCTGLQNRLQPLIRYRIGDVARWAVDQECPCGRQMPILEAIEGRLEDICVLPDGREMLRFDTVFKGVDAIREAQIIQEKPDRFTILVVPGSGFSDKERLKLLENLRLHIGDVPAYVEITDRIERTASGKFKAVVCRLSESEKRQLRKK